VGVPAIAISTTLVVSSSTALAINIAKMKDEMSGDPNDNVGGNTDGVEGKANEGEGESVTFAQGDKKVETKVPEGYEKTKFKSHGQKVFRNKKNGDYITPDTDGHNGGMWKKAKSLKDLGSKRTRSGTYDENLNRIGD